MTAALLLLAVVALGALARVVIRGRAPRQHEPRRGANRVLVPFTGGELEPRVLEAAIRVARAEDAVLVPAYLLVVPMQLGEDSPLLEAVELAALRTGVPVDARIEKGRTATHALKRLWEVERFDRVIAPAPADRGRAGFSPQDLTWILRTLPLRRSC